MPLTAHDLSVAAFVRGLNNLKSLLMKGEAYASASGIDAAELLKAQLAGDMYNLAVQVHWAAEGAKLAAARLAGIETTPLAEAAKTFEGLYERIDAAVAHLGSFKATDLEAGLGRTIEMRHRDRSMTFTGGQFLAEFAIPSFFFHVTTAYGILRHKGVPITKGDFLGSAP
jgi:hypothetical protein